MNIFPVYTVPAFYLVTHSMITTQELVQTVKRIFSIQKEQKIRVKATFPQFGDDQTEILPESWPDLKDQINIVWIGVLVG